MSEIIVSLAFILLGIALVITFIRLIKGPTLPDRVVALEMMASLTVAFIGVYAVASERGEFLDVAMVLVYALSFIFVMLLVEWVILQPWERRVRRWRQA